MLSSEIGMVKENEERTVMDKRHRRRRRREVERLDRAATALLPHVAGAHDCLRYCPSDSPALSMLRALLDDRVPAGFLDSNNIHMLITRTLLQRKCFQYCMAELCIV
jgi:hypothetical protein